VLSSGLTPEPPQGTYEVLQWDTFLIFQSYVFDDAMLL